jgi:hypothetical protein
LSKPRNILPTLIYNLAVIFPRFRKTVADCLRNDPNLTAESMKDSLFLDFLHKIPHDPNHPLVFVIDAFDECGDKRSRPALLRLLTGAAASASWLKIIITSRPEADIQQFFDGLTRSSYLDMIWLQIKKPVMICEPSPKASSNRSPEIGVSPHLGQKNRS